MTGRTIVIPVNDSKQSSHCISWAIQHFIDPSDKITLVNMRPQPLLEQGPKAEEHKQLNKQSLSDSLHLLQTHAKQFGKPVVIQSLYGFPKSDFVTYLELVQPDMVLMGTRGIDRKPILGQGSVSNYILQHSSSPVLIVRDTSPNDS
ncbi:hypothetical protein EDD86DRAFT_185469 [Gorgonomyces haynaldii]|nr:hypothetical protein EDD86DRAFT_185469 [Gorgonomyces haynaldii]